MNLKALTLTVILGLSTPILTDTLVSSSAISQPALALGNFSDRTWSVSLWYENNAYYYQGRNFRTGDSIFLSGAEVGGSPQRRTFTWRNGGYRYQVAWQPNDPNVIRLQVFSPNGRQILNRLLRRSY